MGTDEFSGLYGDLLFGSYDCVDCVVFNAYITLCYTPDGFRVRRRLLDGGEDRLDNAHLMRMAGRFSRRVRPSANAHGIPVNECKRGERMYQIAEEYLADHYRGHRSVLIFVARAVLRCGTRSPARPALSSRTWPRAGEMPTFTVNL